MVELKLAFGDRINIKNPQDVHAFWWGLPCVSVLSLCLTRSKPLYVENVMGFCQHELDYSTVAFPHITSVFYAQMLQSLSNMCFGTVLLGCKN